MMGLTTVSIANDNHGAIVFWRTGMSNKGVLDVRFMFKAADGEASTIAELIAIKHLVLEKKVFRVVPRQGKSLVLNVSNEAILDLVRESTQPSLTQKFASFLSGRLSGVNLQVSKSLENMVPLDTPVTDQSYTVLVAEAWEYANDRELVKTPSMGDVWVTRHAVDRYLERNSSAVDGIRAPWAALVSRLTRNKMERVQINSRVMRHKLRKYQDSKVEIWSQPNDPMRFVLVPKGYNTKVLVTLFERNDEYM